MAMIEISTPSAPIPGGHYAQGTRTGKTIWTSGQVGIDPATGLVESGFGPQATQALKNALAVVEASGAAITDIVKTTCLLTDVANFAEFNLLYAEFFGDHRPARSTFVVGLAGGFVFEVEMMAISSATEGSFDKPTAPTSTLK